MNDPLARFVFQPLVDATRIDPRRAGLRCTDLFMLSAVSTAAARVVTGGPIEDPWANGLDSAMLVIGMGMLWPFVRFFADTGPVSISGLFGGIHLLMRTLFLATAIVDVVWITSMIAAEPGTYDAAGFLRQSLQLCMETFVTCALYLAMCLPPPPPRRDERLVTT